MGKEKQIKKFNEEYKELGYSFKPTHDNMFVDHEKKVIIKLVSDKNFFMDNRMNREKIKLWKTKGYVYLVFSFNEFNERNFNFIFNEIRENCY
jgi:hypothetical protein